MLQDPTGFDTASVPCAGGVDTSLALALMRQLTQPVILMDPDGRVTQINAAGMACLAAGTVDAPNGRFWWELWPHANRDELHAALADAATGETMRITLNCKRAVSSTATLTPIEDEIGRVAKILCVLRA